MTQDELKKFVDEGGVEKIGHAAYALLSLISQKAEEQGYPEIIEISVRESMYKAKIRSYQRLCQVRDNLKEEGCIKSYEPKGDTGFYYLNYD
ncbi:hypothetical protein [Maledivibacter halophilus]|uniref:Helix-turn-helix domain-containing protein n=1 Tax=Maledivibacter halophilus TaxID=36842 RepID=A0A1T5MF80_9FIRM|nr:hypothetical protein [Maledivibacter halophilus]SKC86901.1 hypothetical protein SAMN02194393_04594 [Maledivibacter halophilus]